MKGGFSLMIHGKPVIDQDGSPTVYESPLAAQRALVFLLTSDHIAYKTARARVRGLIQLIFWLSIAVVAAAYILRGHT